MGSLQEMDQRHAAVRRSPSGPGPATTSAGPVTWWPRPCGTPRPAGRARCSWTSRSTCSSTSSRTTRPPGAVPDGGPADGRSRPGQGGRPAPRRGRAARGVRRVGRAVVERPRCAGRAGPRPEGSRVPATRLGRGCLPPDHPFFFAAARKLALQEADVVCGPRGGLGLPARVRPQGTGRRREGGPGGRRRGPHRPEPPGRRGDRGRPRPGHRAARRRRGRGAPPSRPWTARVRDEEARRAEGPGPGWSRTPSRSTPSGLPARSADFLDQDAIVVGDGGDIVGISASIVQARYPGHWLNPGRSARWAWGRGSRWPPSSPSPTSRCW